MKKIIRIDDGFSKGLTQKMEKCGWCGNAIWPYIKCYYGGGRVGNIIICGKCGDEARQLEDEAKYGN